MTAACGGGTSAPKLIASAVVDYSAGLLGAIFASYGLRWLIPVIPFVGLAPLTLSTFCASDPPTMPTFTSAEANALLQLKFGPDFDSGLGKLKDLALNTIWWDACRCTSGALVPLVPPTPPAGTPIYQPPVPVASTPCTSFAGNVTTPGGGNFAFTGSLNFGLFNVTTVRLRVYSTIFSGGGQNVTILNQFRDANQTDMATDYHTYTVLPGSGLNIFDIRVPPGARSNYSNTTFQAGTGATTLQIITDGYCNGDIPGLGNNPCCPPDTATQAYLDQLLKLVTLIQRQTVPFAYVASTVHTGLSGAGTLNIQGLLGVKVTATTVPSSYGLAGTTPAEHFDLGFLTFGTADGYPHSIRLEHSPQLMLPARASVFTDLAYDLAPGVVVTITELLREP